MPQVTARFAAEELFVVDGHADAAAETSTSH